MSPLARLLLPSAAGGDAVSMGSIRAIAAMPLDDDDVTASEVLAADPAQDLIPTSDPTASAWAQYRLRLLRKRLP
jgi:hypothetical protein